MESDPREHPPHSETLLTPGPLPPPEPGPAAGTAAATEPTPRATEARPDPSRPRNRTLRQGLGGLGRYPLLLLAAYYAVLITVDWLLVTYVPAVRRAFVQPGADAVPATSENFLTGMRVRGIGDSLTPVLNATLDRALSTLLVILGALSLVVPVAWLYMRTKRFRYDPALVRSVIILPVVVAGIAIVVKNSIALAFSLAGIVAAVRFRNTLKDPRDAVYIFLVIGIGLSAGVQALDVALVMSLLFNLVVLVLWRYNIGSVYSGRYGRTGILSVGDPELMVAQLPDAQRQIRRRLLQDAAEIRSDGILLVHSADIEVARQTVQEALGDMARDWMLADIVRREEGVSTLEYVLRLKRQVLPADLVGALDERWATHLAAAEYIPFRTRKKKRDGKTGKPGRSGKEKSGKREREREK